MGKTSSNGFLKHFAIIGAGTLFNLMIGLFTTPVITRIVAPVKYGQMSVFTMYQNIAIMVLCMGLDQALVRFYYENDSIDYKRALLLKCIRYPIAVSIVVSALVIVASALDFVQFEFNTNIMVLLCVFVICGLVYRFSQLIVRLSYKSKIYSFLNVLQKVSYVSVALAMVLLVPVDHFVALAFATLLSLLICMLVSLFAQPTIWSIKDISLSACNILQSELIRYAYPYIFSMGITTLFQVIDKISLNYFYTYAEVGIYASAMSLVHVFAIIQTTFNTLWTPMSVEHYADNPEDRSFYQKGNQIITVVMFLIGFTLIFVKDIFAILLGAKYREAAYILPFLIFNPIMYTISETTVGGLVFKKKSNMQVVVAIVACAVNIIGNILLVPKFACQGAAISTGISYIVFFTARTLLANRYFYVDFKLKRFYLLTGLAIVYALYNTFTKFNIGAVIGYFICMSLLLFLYFDTVKYCVQYGMETIKKIATMKG